MDKAAQAVEITGTRALLGWAMFGTQGHEEIEKIAAFVREWQDYYAQPLNFDNR